MNTKHEGLLSNNTIKGFKEADRKLMDAFQFLEATVMIASEEIAGGHPSEVSDEAGNLISSHPLVKAAWELVASIEEKHAKLQGLLKLEVYRRMANDGD